MRRNVMMRCFPMLSLVAVVPMAVAAGDGVSGVTQEVSVTAATFEAGPRRGLVPVAPSGLQSLGGVNAVPQGIPGAQADLQVLGGAFNASGLGWGAVPLRNPQTEHLQSDLPFPAALFGTPSVVGGLSADGELAKHPAGTIELGLRPLQPGGRWEAGGGDHGQRWVEGIVSDTWGMREQQVGGGVFGRQSRVEGVDYPDNDVESWSAGGLFQVLTPAGQADVAAAHQERDFGARGYYGAPDRFPARERVADTLVVADTAWGENSDVPVRVTAAWRSVDDTYWLDRTRPDFYRNRHDSETATLGTEGAWSLGRRHRVVWQAMAEGESLDSSNLGDHRRTRSDTMLGWEERSRSIVLTGGLRAQMFEDESPEWAPVLGLRVGRKREGQFYLTHAGLTRQPSYTELFYRSISSEGNPGLPLSRSATTAFGYRWENSVMSADARCFLRDEAHAADWVWNPASNRWEATDVGDVRTEGALLTGSYELGPSFSLGQSYAFVHKESDVEPYAARYVLDYPEHRYRVDATWRVGHGLELHTAQTLRRQAPNRLRQRGRTGVEGELQAVYRLPVEAPIRLTLACANLWDDDFQYVPGQKAPVRLVSAGLGGSW